MFGARVECLGIALCLKWGCWQTTETSTGHKMLPPYLRVIQGDGISLESLKLILVRAMNPSY